MQRAVLVVMMLVAGAASAGNVQGGLLSNTTWTVEGSPYTLTDDVIVAEWVTLTIHPGVQVIAATGVELSVRGNLQVLGTETQPVIFKGSGTGTGQWGGIILQGSGAPHRIVGALIQNGGLQVSGSNVSATVSHCTLSNGGTGATGVHVYTNGTFAMDHTVIHGFQTIGVYVNRGTVNLQHNTLVNNGRYGVYAYGSYNLTLRNSIVTGNLYGLYRDTNTTTDSTATLSHNVVWGNASADYYGESSGPNSFSADPLFVSPSNFRITSYSLARKAASDGSSDIGALPYAGDVSPVVAGVLHENTTLSGSQTLVGDFIVPAGVTLTVAPGTTFTVATTDAMRSGKSLSKVELIVRGTLLLQGTDTSPVTFKAATAGSAQWHGVRVEGGGTTRISGALLRDAQYGLEVTGTGTSATLTSSTLTGNSTGAYVHTGGTLAMDHTIVHGNSSHGVHVGNGIADLQYNTFVSNGFFGVYATADNTLTLRNSIITGQGYGIYLPYRTGTQTLSHNNVWGNSSGDYTNVTAGPSSFSANPLFVSPIHYRLTTWSPARKAASDGSSDLGALPYAGDAATTLAGTLHEDTLLSGPQTLTGDLLVPAGVTLTLAPGTTFTVATTDSMKSGADISRVELIVRGTLRVQGSYSSPVTFKAATAGAGQWRGVRVEAGDSTTLSHALIQNAFHGLEVTGTGTSATLSSSTLTGNITGAYVHTGGTLAMDHTVVHNSTTTGVNVGDGTAHLEYNTFTSSSGTNHGVQLSASGHTLTLRNSIVTRHFYGVHRAANTTGSVTLSHNDVWSSISRDYENVTADPDSFSADPLFISTTDFRLRAASPCRGVGVDGTDVGAWPYDARFVARMELSPTSVTVDAAGTTAFSARGYNPEGNLVSDANYTWSARPAAGTIDAATGVLTASCTPGTTTAAVTATSPSGVSASASVTVVIGPAAQVTLSPMATGIEAGASRLFTATVRDSCGNPRTGHTLDWSTLPGTGTITDLGEYTAPCGPGEYPGAVIARSGAFSASANVSVSTGPLAQLGVSPESPGVSAGGQQLFTALAADSCGNSLAPTVSWSVVNGGGDINPNGLFTAGTVPGFFADSIQVTSGTQVARTSVTVTGGPIASLELGPSPASVGPNGEVSFTATARDAYGNIVSATPTWSVINGGGDIDPTTGTFTAGTVAGTYEGTVRAVAGSASATATVTVTAGPADRMEVSPSPARLSPRGSVRFTARVLDVHGNVREDSVTWSLLSSSAGTLGADGTFIATTQPGTWSEVVRAEASGKSAYATVIVQPGALARLLLEPTSASLQVGASQAFSVRGQDEHGNDVAVSPSWQVVNGGGEISVSGTFKAGTVASTYKDTVRVSAEGLSASASIEVTAGPVARVLLTPSNPSVPTRTSLQFTARAEDAFGNERAGQPRWTSSAEAGTLNATGLFTAGSTAGDHPSAVTATVDGVSASTSVTVLSQGNPDGGTGGGTEPDPKPNPGGCGCSGTTDASASFVGLLLLALVVSRQRMGRAGR